MLNKNRSFAVDGHSQKVEAYLSVRERILSSELKSSLVAISKRKQKYIKNRFLVSLADHHME